MSEEELATQAAELRLDPESIEALARRLAELLGGGESQRPRRQLISAEEVSRWWGVSRRWVYDNAERLGARRLGTGPRPRLRFDPDEVAEQLGEPGERPNTRRVQAISGDCRFDSLSLRTRANVAQRRQQTSPKGESDSGSRR